MLVTDNLPVVSEGSPIYIFVCSPSFRTVATLTLPAGSTLSKVRAALCSLARGGVTSQTIAENVSADDAKEFAALPLSPFDFTLPFCFMRNNSIPYSFQNENAAQLISCLPVLPSFLYRKRSTPRHRWAFPGCVKAADSKVRWCRLIVSHVESCDQLPIHIVPNPIDIERVMLSTYPTSYGVCCEADAEWCTKISEWNVNATDYMGYTLLHECVIAGVEEGISFLLAHPTIRVNERDLHGNTALHWAIKRLHHRNSSFDAVKCVEQLLYAGADPLVQNEAGNTPLHFSFLYSQPVAEGQLCWKLRETLEGSGRSVTDILDTRNNAGVSVRDLFNRSVCLYSLCSSGTEAGIGAYFSHFLTETTSLSDCVEGNSALHVAAAGRNTKVLQCLLSLSESSPFYTSEAALNFRRQTPLHVAVAARSIDCVQLLCEKNPKLLSVVDIGGNTPLLTAVKARDMACARLLLTRYSTSDLLVHARDNQGFAVLHFLCGRGLFDVAADLIERHGVTPPLNRADHGVPSGAWRAKNPGLRYNSFLVDSERKKRHLPRHGGGSVSFNCSDASRGASSVLLKFYHQPDSLIFMVTNVATKRKLDVTAFLSKLAMLGCVSTREDLADMLLYLAKQNQSVADAIVQNSKRFGISPALLQELKENNYLLLHLCRQKYADGIRWCVQAGLGSVHVCNTSEEQLDVFSPLQTSVQAGDLATVKYFLSLGANANYSSPSRCRCPLDLVLRSDLNSSCYHPIVHALVTQGGCSLEVQYAWCDHPWSALEEAAVHLKDDAVKGLLGFPFSSLSAPVMALSRLLQDTFRKWMPLPGSRRRHLKWITAQSICKSLARAVNAESFLNGSGRTHPCDVIAMCVGVGFVDVAHVLVNKLIDLKEKQYSFHDAFKIDSSAPCSDDIDWNPEIPFSCYFTKRDAISYASQLGDVEMVSSLLLLGVKPWLCGDGLRGWNAADYALHNGKQQCFRLLLLHGVVPLCDHPVKRIYDTQLSCLVQAANAVKRMSPCLSTSADLLPTILYQLLCAILDRECMEAGKLHFLRVLSEALSLKPSLREAAALMEWLPPVAERCVQCRQVCLLRELTTTYGLKLNHCSSALLWAIIRGYMDCASILVEQGCSLTEVREISDELRMECTVSKVVRLPSSMSPIFVATLQCNVEMVYMLTHVRQPPSQAPSTSSPAVLANNGSNPFDALRIRLRSASQPNAESDALQLLRSLFEAGYPQNDGELAGLAETLAARKFHSCILTLYELSNNSFDMVSLLLGELQLRLLRDLFTSNYEYPFANGSEMCAHMVADVEKWVMIVNQLVTQSSFRVLANHYRVIISFLRVSRHHQHRDILASLFRRLIVSDQVTLLQRVGDECRRQGINPSLIPSVYSLAMSHSMNQTLLPSLLECEFFPSLSEEDIIHAICRSVDLFAFDTFLHQTPREMMCTLCTTPVACDFLKNKQQLPLMHGRAAVTSASPLGAAIMKGNAAWARYFISAISDNHTTTLRDKPISYSFATLKGVVSDQCSIAVCCAAAISDAYDAKDTHRLQSCDDIFLDLIRCNTLKCSSPEINAIAIALAVTRRWQLLQALIQNAASIIDDGYEERFFSILSDSSIPAVLKRVVGDYRHVLQPVVLKGAVEQIKEVALRSRRSHAVSVADGRGRHLLYLAMLRCSSRRSSRAAEWNATLWDGVMSLGLPIHDICYQPTSQTPLMVAASHGWVAPLKKILKKSGDLLNSRDARWRTPLTLAAEHGHLTSVQLLMSAGADPTLKDRRGFTAAMYAAANGHDKVALELMASCMWEGRPASATTLLHCIAIGGCERSCEVYLSKESDPVAAIFMKDESNATPLILARGFGRGAIIRQLMTALSHADVTSDMEGASKEDRRILTCDSSLYRYGWLQQSLRATELLYRDALSKCSEGERTYVERLEHSFPLLPAKNHRLSPNNMLNWCALHRYDLGIRALADLNVADTEGALHCAARRGFIDITDTLLSLRMSNPSEPYKGVLAFEVAAGAGHTDCALLLLNATSDVAIQRCLSEACEQPDGSENIFHRLSCVCDGRVLAALIHRVRSGGSEAVTALYGVLRMADFSGFNLLERSIAMGQPEALLRIFYLLKEVERGLQQPHTSQTPLRNEGEVSSGLLRILPLLSPAVRVALFDVLDMVDASRTTGLDKRSLHQYSSRLTFGDVRLIGIHGLQSSEWCKDCTSLVFTPDHERTVLALILKKKKYKIRYQPKELSLLQEAEQTSYLQWLGSSVMLSNYHRIPVKEIQVVIGGANDSLFAVCAAQTASLQHSVLRSRRSLLAPPLNNEFDCFYVSLRKKWKKEVHHALKNLQKKLASIPHALFKNASVHLHWDVMACARDEKGVEEDRRRWGPVVSRLCAAVNRIEVELEFRVSALVNGARLHSNWDNPPTSINFCFNSSASGASTGTTVLFSETHIQDVDGVMKELLRLVALDVDARALAKIKKKFSRDLQGANKHLAAATTTITCDTSPAPCEAIAETLRHVVSCFTSDNNEPSLERFIVKRVLSELTCVTVRCTANSSQSWDAFHSAAAEYDARLGSLKLVVCYCLRTGAAAAPTTGQIVAAIRDGSMSTLCADAKVYLAGWVTDTTFSFRSFLPLVHSLRVDCLNASLPVEVFVQHFVAKTTIIQQLLTGLEAMRTTPTGDWLRQHVCSILLQFECVNSGSSQSASIVLVNQECVVQCVMKRDARHTYSVLAPTLNSMVDMVTDILSDNVAHS